MKFFIIFTGFIALFFLYATLQRIFSPESLLSYEEFSEDNTTQYKEKVE